MADGIPEWLQVGKKVSFKYDEPMSGRGIRTFIIERHTKTRAVLDGKGGYIPFKDVSGDHALVYGSGTWDPSTTWYPSDHEVITKEREVIRRRNAGANAIKLLEEWRKDPVPELLEKALAYLTPYVEESQR